MLAKLGGTDGLTLAAQQDNARKKQKREAPPRALRAEGGEAGRCGDKLVIPGALPFLARDAVLGPRHRLEPLGRDGLGAPCAVHVGAILDPL